jgi:hypothetical protein
MAHNVFEKGVMSSERVGKTHSCAPELLSSRDPYDTLKSDGAHNTHIKQNIRATTFCRLTSALKTP